ncbi:hypothetical protein [Shewanella sp. 6_MG-2023]|uniref:hypothetical protein n=1 Tax=Shewanella sp. 6_MG-2023 TaxID=3062660 RepID=UPI0026E413B8|nr:hypothetical protein [Shewanella sp. 6_MG-2023]MDO6620292.1 hypothetical protein [Shewanella sp. 6_MG-2023]
MSNRSIEPEKKENTLNIRPVTLFKMSVIVIVIYTMYYIYTVSGFSFIKGVENSFKKNNSVTIASTLDSPITEMLDTLPKDILSTCSTPLTVDTYTVDIIEESNKDTNGEVERIAVTGSSISRSSLELPPETNVTKALLDVTSKVLDKEAAEFIGEYGAKVAIDGLYSLRKIPHTNNKKWQLILSHNCIRVTRLFNEVDNIELGSDIIFQIQLSKTRSHFRLSPIYINIKNSYAKSLTQSVSLSGLTTMQWVSTLDYFDHEPVLTENHDEFTFENLILGQKTFLNKTPPNKISMSYLHSVKLDKASTWFPAPGYNHDDIKECIKNSLECDFLTANLTFNLTEKGSGTNKISDVISLMTK